MRESLKNKRMAQSAAKFRIGKGSTTKVIASAMKKENN